MDKMRTYGLVGLLLLLGAALVGCGNADNNHAGHGGPPTGSMIGVEISIEPQAASAGQEVDLKAAVTQDAEQVEDADEVMFEVRQSGSDDRAMLMGEHAGEGMYTVTHVFPEAGTYFVTAHVTARGMHNMPTLEVDIAE
ncbi:FixH family protein [Xylanibacillus composti]|uniref:YtkA-like domain-containing protein n=1 Tax=Xylanibacillus composti TaxID=1572762 RepID=A0A8J4GYY3_9BACL|nr:FixH family protein [Xylanibacillus composti]GIQ67724.1 hypothetical protein XYCOK13_05480 [Xylanibacillus composti]